MTELSSDLCHKQSSICLLGSFQYNTEEIDFFLYYHGVDVVKGALGMLSK